MPVRSSSTLSNAIVATPQRCDAGDHFMLRAARLCSGIFISDALMQTLGLQISCVQSINHIPTIQPIDKD
jgi:hypothetical protein